MARPTKGRAPLRALLVAGAVIAIGLVLAAAASAAAPQNTAPPTVSGTPRVGQTLTASDGTWSNSPSSFTHQWQRCASDGSNCGDITGAVSKTYTVATGDVGRTIRVAVTAVNTDGKTAANSAPTDVVATKNGPTNTVKPAVSGSAVVGGTLTVSNGTWTPTPTSFGRQWQRCASDGTACSNIAGASGQSYGVRADDVGHRVRALVTAHTATDQATTPSSPSDVVTQTTVTTTQTTTTIVTTPPPGAPTVRIMSLRHLGTKIYARFRVCAHNPGRVAITERDQKARALPYTRHLAVRVGTCGTFAKHWMLLPRYRSSGRLLVTMRASSNGQLSRLASRSIRIH